MKQFRFEHVFCKDPFCGQAFIYGISESGFWVIGEAFKAEAEWPALNDIREEDSWLIMNVDGIPPLYFPVKELSRKGCLEEILSLINRFKHK